MVVPPALYTAAPYWAAVLPSNRESLIVALDVPSSMRIAPPLPANVPLPAVLFLNMEFDTSNVEPSRTQREAPVLSLNNESFTVTSEVLAKITPLPPTFSLKVESETFIVVLTPYIAAPDQPAELLLKSLFVTVSTAPDPPCIAPPSRFAWLFENEELSIVKLPCVYIAPPCAYIVESETVFVVLFPSNTEFVTVRSEPVALYIAPPASAAELFTNCDASIVWVPD